MSLRKEFSAVNVKVDRQFELERKARLAAELAAALKRILEECDDPNLAYHMSPLFFWQGWVVLTKYESRKGGK